MTKRRDKHHQITKLIAERLKELRIQKGISQVRLAIELNVSFQQVQKYENGSNRISAALVPVICNLLECTYDDFFSKVSIT